MQILFQTNGVGSNIKDNNRKGRKEFKQRMQRFEYKEIILCVLCEKTLRLCVKKKYKTAPHSFCVFIILNKIVTFALFNFKEERPMELQPIQNKMMEGNRAGEIVLYQPDHSIRLEVRLEDETVWLSLNQIAYLFERDKSVISRHITNVFKEEELIADSVVAKFATTAMDGKMYQVEYFNLDLIISVGYRVKSKRGIQFRQWSNRVLKEYLLRGYAISKQIERFEQFAIETGRQVAEVNVKLDFLKQYIEDIITDQNDINEDTRMQLELINVSLAELQVKNKEINKPRIQVGFVK